MIGLTVNGKPKKLLRPMDLMTFLKLHGIKTHFVAVGYNGEVLDKEAFHRVVLDEGDVLEIVRPVGGG